MENASAIHRTRDLFVKQRTQLVNMISGALAEFAIELARGRHHALALAKQLTKGRAADGHSASAKVRGYNGLTRNVTCPQRL